MIIIDKSSKKQIFGNTSINTYIKSKFNGTPILIENENYFNNINSIDIQKYNSGSYLLVSNNNLEFKLCKIKKIDGRYYSCKNIYQNKEYKILDKGLIQKKTIDFNLIEEDDLIYYDYSFVENIINVASINIIHYFKNIKKIIFKKDFDLDKKLPINIFPHSVKHIEMYDSFNQELVPLLFPPKLEYLLLGELFNKIIYNLPGTIKELVISKDSNFNQFISSLPKDIKIFRLNDIYNIPLDEDIFSDNLEEIYYGDEYSCKLEENILPDGIKKISFGESYKYEISKDIIPQSIEIIEFRYKYNHNTDFTQFKNLKQLIFGYPTKAKIIFNNNVDFKILNDKNK